MKSAPAPSLPSSYVSPSSGFAPLTAGLQVPLHSLPSVSSTAVLTAAGQVIHVSLTRQPRMYA